jgi:hypothetical protein
MRSGYIARAADRMPAQGSRFPWQVHQSFLRDYRAMRMGRLDDGAMDFAAVGDDASTQDVEAAEVA